MRRIALLLSFLIVPTAYGDDWPQWLGPKRDGIWRETGIVDTLPKDGPKKLWSIPTGIGYAGPAVASGKLFVADRQLSVGQKNPMNPFDRNTAVEGNERIMCVDASTGKEIWKHEYPCVYTVSYAAGPRCTPTVDGDRVYQLGAMGDLVCLNVTDGKLLWKKNLVKDFDAKVPVWGFACHPLVDGDRLIVVGGGQDKLVIAFDKKSGEPIWKSQNCEGDFGYSPPVILDFAGQRQLIVWHARAVVGLNPESGKRLWSVPFDVRAALTAPTPRKVGEDKLFVTSFYNGSMLIKVGSSSAEIVWKSKAKGEAPNLTTDLSSIMCTPMVDGETVYGVCSYGELRGLNVLTGERKWVSMQATRGALTPKNVQAQDEPAQSERWSNAFIVKNENRHFLFNEQGDLIIAKLSPSGYSELSRAHLIDPTNTMARGRKVVWMHPAFANKCVFVRNDEQLIAYSLAK